MGAIYNDAEFGAKHGKEGADMSSNRSAVLLNAMQVGTILAAMHSENTSTELFLQAQTHLSDY